MAGYQGWTNYETWLVALWINNDEYLHDEARTLESPENLKDWIESLLLEGEKASLKMDLITAALSKVNWKEIFKSFKEE